MALIRRNMDFTSGGPAVNVIFFKDFLTMPPDLFVVRDNCFHHDPRRLNVCDRSEERRAFFPDTMGGCLKVSTEGELANLTHKLLSAPIFFTVNMKRIHKTPGTRTTYINKESVAVFVNTQHEYVQEHIKGLLAEAMEYMQQGKNFAVELDFGEVMSEWLRDIYTRLGQSGNAFSTRYRCKYGKLTVTNYGEYSETFSCGNCPAAMYYWFFCLPCCLLTWPVYTIQRKLRVADIGGSILGVAATTFKPLGPLTYVEDAINAALRQHNQRGRQQELVQQVPLPHGPPVYNPPPQPINAPPPYTSREQPKGPYEEPAQVVYGNVPSLI